MQSPFVLTILGPDQPGLVDSLARVVERHGGNWLESRMCHLGGQFAGILRIVVPDASKGSLETALREVSDGVLDVIVHEDSGMVETRLASSVTLEFVGQDRPGIVRSISEAFARHGANVEELATECRPAPMSGEMLFEAKARLGLPDGGDFGALQDDLERIASDLMVDLTFGED